MATTQNCSPSALSYTLNVEYIIAPHTLCDTCGNNSGPKFILNHLIGISHAHRTNRIPIDVELQSVQNEISHAESEILQLDAEIDRLEQVVSSLKQRRNELQNFKIQKQSLFAPIRKLPEDVLEYLFLACQWHLEPDGYIQACNRDTFVGTVTQICVQWHSVALSCRKLWSRISFYFDKNHWRYDSHYDRIMGPIRLERFILLSGQVPLHIWFPQVSGLLGDRCTEVVINSVHRWETITIANGALLETISTRIPGDVTFSCLKYLSLSNITHSMSLYPSPRMTHLNLADIETQGITISLQSAPSLTHLCVSGLEQISDMLIDFPWIQITHFECSFGFFGEELSGIIQSMPNLTLFKLRGSSMISECISFPRLRMLMLVGGLRGYYTNVLDTKFTAPQLKVLHLNDNKYCHLSDIFQFLQRSDCQFEELTMNNIYTPRSDEDWKVEQLQKVKKLHLKQPDFGTTSFIQNLCYVLPELETLVISDLQLYDASKEITLVDDLTILLRSRLGSPVPQSSSERKCSLKSVTVEFEFDRRTLDMDIENTMRDFIRSDLVRQAGIALTISYGTHDNPSKYIVLNGVEQHDTETISGI